MFEMSSDIQFQWTPASQSGTSIFSIAMLYYWIIANPNAHMCTVCTDQFHACVFSLHVDAWVTLDDRMYITLCVCVFVTWFTPGINKHCAPCYVDSVHVVILLWCICFPRIRPNSTDVFYTCWDPITVRLSPPPDMVSYGFADLIAFQLQCVLRAFTPCINTISPYPDQISTYRLHADSSCKWALCV